MSSHAVELTSHTCIATKQLLQVLGEGMLMNVKFLCDITGTTYVCGS